MGPPLQELGHPSWVRPSSELVFWATMKVRVFSWQQESGIQDTLGPWGQSWALVENRSSGRVGNGGATFIWGADFGYLLP